jgi:hypothetical protein
VARDIENITVKDVLDILEQYGSDNIPVEHSPELDKLAESLKAYGEIFGKSPANVRLKDV